MLEVEGGGGGGANSTFVGYVTLVLSALQLHHGTPNLYISVLILLLCSVPPPPLHRILAHSHSLTCSQIRRGIILTKLDKCLLNIYHLALQVLYGCMVVHDIAAMY